MTRVSLKEAYDNKDVIAQIYAIRDTAESAEDSAEQAVTTANTASDHVDALVPQVEGAVENANSASASAQASAQTVAGYENRLATVESDLNAVTLRITTAEGDIVTIQGRVTALETADDQNVKLTGEHAIGDYAVLLTGNQTKRGQLTFAEYVIHPMQRQDFAISQNVNTPWVKLFEIPTARRQVRGKMVGLSAQAFFVIDNGSNTAPIVRIGGWGFTGADWIAVTYNDGDDKIGVWFKTPNYASEKIFIEEIGNYGGANTYDYLILVQNPEYVALPTGDYVTYSTAWAAIQ